MEEPNWKAIIAVALDADSRLGKCNKPGRASRWIYVATYRRACALGYEGDEDDWHSFIRVRAAAHYGLKRRR